MRCKVCGEVMVFGPAGCACTRKYKQETEQRELARMAARLAKIRWEQLELDVTEEPKP